MDSSRGSTDGRTYARFPQTQWTLVQSAQETDAGKSAKALEELFRSYWRPVYAYIRRRGNRPADAEDLTQGFFATLLARRSFDGVDASKGRLRTFLLTSVSRYMASEHERAIALKRGGGAAVLPLDCGLAEEGFVADPGHAVTPDLEFERQWALRLLAESLENTRAVYERRGRLPVFEELKGHISLDSATDSFAAIGERLGMTEGAVKVAAHRLRADFRDCLRANVADTVDTADQVEDEIRHLLEIFAPPG